MECEGNCGENCGIASRTAEKEKLHWHYNGNKEETQRISRTKVNYVMIYCGLPANQWPSSGVPITIRKEWEHKKQDDAWTSDRIIETRIKVLNRNFTIVGVCAPIGEKEQDTEELYMELQQSWTKSIKSKILF